MSYVCTSPIRLMAISLSALPGSTRSHTMFCKPTNSKSYYYMHRRNLQHDSASLWKQKKKIETKSARGWAVRDQTTIICAKESCNPRRVDYNNYVGDIFKPIRFVSSRVGFMQAETVKILRKPGNKYEGINAMWPWPRNLFKRSSTSQFRQVSRTPRNHGSCVLHILFYFPG